MFNYNGKVASSPTDASGQVTWEVVNNRDHAVRIQWIDFQGKISETGFVVAANSSMMPGTTYDNHIFLVRKDGESNPQQAFVGVYNISGPQTVIA